MGIRCPIKDCNWVCNTPKVEGTLFRELLRHLSIVARDCTELEEHEALLMEIKDFKELK